MPVPDGAIVRATDLTELDGRAASAEELRALALLPYGSFTTLLSEDGRTTGLDRHLERLASDSTALFGRPPASADRLRDLLRRAARTAPRVVVRATVLAPGTSLAEPEADRPLSLLVTTRAAPPRGGGAPLRLSTVRFQRELPEIKHVGLTAALHHRRQARRSGLDDALFVSGSGHVLEGPTWNVGLCSAAGEVVWPSGPRLTGVTMSLLHEAVGASRHAPVPWTELRAHPAGWTAFVTSATAGVRPVASIDGVRLDTRPEQVDALQRAHDALPRDTV